MNKTVCFSETTRIADRAFVEFDCMNHAVSVEEMVAGDRFVKWVGSVSDVDALNAVGDLSGSGKVLADGFLGHRREVSGDLDGGVGCFGERMLTLLRNQCVFDCVQG